MKYDVLATPDLEELCKWVNEKLKQGWQLQGGIATMTHPPRYTVFYQAIVKPTNIGKTDIFIIIVFFVLFFWKLYNI